MLIIYKWRLGTVGVPCDGGAWTSLWLRHAPSSSLAISPRHSYDKNNVLLRVYLVSKFEINPSFYKVDKFTNPIDFCGNFGLEVQLWGWNTPTFYNVGTLKLHMGHWERTFDNCWRCKCSGANHISQPYLLTAMGLYSIQNSYWYVLSAYGSIYCTLTFYCFLDITWVVHKLIHGPSQKFMDQDHL